MSWHQFLHRKGNVRIFRTRSFLLWVFAHTFDKDYLYRKSRSPTWSSSSSTSTTTSSVCLAVLLVVVGLLVVVLSKLIPAPAFVVCISIIIKKVKLCLPVATLYEVFFLVILVALVHVATLVESRAPFHFRSTCSALLCSALLAARLTSHLALGAFRPFSYTIFFQDDFGAVFVACHEVLIVRTRYQSHGRLR